MSVFVTVEGGDFEYEISRSRFIGICRRVNCDDEAASVLNEIRRKYNDCTHVCYAYVTEQSSRSSDDGEPSGTAGMPIMESIRAAKLSNTLVAVVRYFGGIKLGTGGLVRAYTHTATESLRISPKKEVADCAVFTVCVDYAVWKKIEKRPLQSLYKLLRMEYNKTVDIMYATQDPEALQNEILSLTQGKCEIRRMGNERVERTQKQ